MSALKAAATTAAQRKLLAPKPAIDPRFPLTTSLTDIFAVPLPRGKKDNFKWRPRENANRRTEIVNQKACEDIINYLSPTLEQHKGCTIIDLHPGACLWSAEMHKHLKPRRHILMEPDERYFEPFIKPLLDQPGSKYVHVATGTPLGFGGFDYWQKGFSDLSRNSDVVPQTARASESEAPRTMNPSILVIGNLARSEKVITTINRPGSYTWRIFTGMVLASLRNHHVNRNGPVRILWWVPEAEKSGLLGTCESAKSTTNFNIHMAGVANEVAGTAPVGERTGYYIVRRSPYLETNRAVDIRRKMDESGMRVPKGRVLNIQPSVKLPSGVTLKSPFEQLPANIEALQSAVEETEARVDGISDWPGSGRQIVAPDIMSGLLSSMKYPHCLSVCEQSCADGNRFIGTNQGMKRTAILLDVMMQILHLEAGVKSLEEEAERQGHDSGDQMKSLRKRIAAADDMLNAAIFEVRPLYANSVRPLFDEQHSFFSKPSPLPYDHRLYEPIKVDREDYWPHNPLALIDFIPSDRDLAVPDLADRTEASKICIELFRGIFLNSATGITETLDRLAPNAAKDLIPHVPSLMDPRRGGRLNPRNVRPRTMTVEMFEALMRAFVEWPFRPSTLQLELEDRELSSARNDKFLESLESATDPLDEEAGSESEKGEEEDDNVL